MRQLIIILAIFFISFFIYFGVSTQFTFKPKWFLDYYNPLAKSLIVFRLDIQNLGTNYDLAYFNGKWYAPWGILPALFLIPIQLIMGRFVPILYLSIFFASLNIVFFYLILQRLKDEFLPKLSSISLYTVLILFAFGTTHFYVGTLGGVWHVNQMVTSFFGTLGMYFIFRKKRRTFHYITSALLFSIAFLGRPTVALLIWFPIILYLFDVYKKTSEIKKMIALKKGLLIFVLPFLFFSSLFFVYNYIRFHNPFEYGYAHMNEASYLEQRRLANGVTSLKNIPHNLWHMFFEVPSLTLEDKINVSFNLKGNSIFFLTPPLFAAFLASPLLIKKRKKIILNSHVFALWTSVIIATIPSLMFYNSGWIQFGFRYSLDIVVLLIILSIFGVRGRLNLLYIFGVFFAIIIHLIGINALM